MRFGFTSYVEVIGTEIICMDATCKMQRRCSTNLKLVTGKNIAVIEHTPNIHSSMSMATPRERLLTYGAVIAEKTKLEIEILKLRIKNNEMAERYDKLKNDYGELANDFNILKDSYENAEKVIMDIKEKTKKFKEKNPTF